MQIVHVDPGYGRLMELYSNTELDYVENSTYNPTSGVAFTCTSGSWSFFPNFDFTFEPTEGQFLKKVWAMKLSIYSEENESSIVYAGFSHVLNGNPLVGIRLMEDSFSFLHYVENVQTAEYYYDISAGFHNVSITYSLTADGTGSEMTYIRTTTIDFDGVVDFQTHTTTTEPSYLPLYGQVYFGGGSKHYYVSNVLLGQATYEGDGTGDIPSDDGIPTFTPIYRLPTGATVTDFTQGEDGEYIGTANGQTLLQTVDASTLISTFGDKPINHIVAYGAPGYRVGTAVTQATGISKEDDAITSHGTHALSFEKDMHVYDVWKIEDGSAFSDINGLAVGWRAGD